MNVVKGQQGGSITRFAGLLLASRVTTRLGIPFSDVSYAWSFAEGSDVIVWTFSSLTKRTGVAPWRRHCTFMTEDEVEECRTKLKGVSVPLLESCPNLSVSDVFNLERAGRSVWEGMPFEDHCNWHTIRLCLVLDTMYRDCHFCSVTNLWEVMVTAEHHCDPFGGQVCQLGDILVTMPQIIKYSS